MKLQDRELPKDRLSTTDAKGHRIYIYPSDVRGIWKKRRFEISIGLIAVFLGLPWFRIGGHQALLLDIPHRRFAILGLTFWAHDTPMLFFVVGGAVVTIAFVTAIWGRVWCGWACPQTVFVDQVFRRVERWIEGDSVQRKKLDQDPLSLNKVFKKSAKWFIFTLLALVLSHSFLAYFVGTEALGDMMAHSPSQNPSAFFIALGVAAAILFDFGWFREQFCTIVCPYGRFQSVLMDSQSMVVAYDVKRGEPRKGSKTTGSLGDCVNCYRCVQVCPTGIDIRRGVQLECIACTACIDACDDVMSRLKKPLGLIRYGSLALTEGQTETPIPGWKRPRAWIYLGLLLGCVVGLTLTIQNRAEIELTLIRAAEAPYQEIPSADGQSRILNHFKIDLRNQTFNEQEISFSVNSDLQKQGVILVVSNHKNKLGAGEPERADLFIQFPKSFLKMGHASLPIQLQTHSISMTKEVSLVGPLR